MKPPQNTPGAKSTQPMNPNLPNGPRRSWPTIGHWSGHVVGATAIAISLYLASAKNASENEFRKQTAEQHQRLQAEQNVVAARERDLVTAKAETADFQTQLSAAVKKSESQLQEAGEKLAAREREIATAKSEIANCQALLDAALKKGAEAEAVAQEAMRAVDKDTEYRLVIDTLTHDKNELEKRVSLLSKKDEQVHKDGVEKSPRGKVVAAEPAWGFTILNLGDKQGARPNTTYTVARDGSPIGSVKITSVEDNKSVAEILPGTFARGASVRLGDDVFVWDDKAASPK